VEITLDDAHALAAPVIPAAPTHVPTLESASQPDRRARPSATMDEEPEGIEPRAAWRKVGVIVLCFLLGIGLTTAIAYRMNLIGSSGPVQPSIDDAVAKAEDALRHKRFDTPPGDNVRDLTRDALARWPKEARLTDIRSRACDELVKDAVGRQLQGDPTGALERAQLARDLDPSDATAQKLVEEYEALVKGKGAPPSIVVVPSLDAGSAKPVFRGPVTASGPYRTAMDVAPAKPHVGQAVDLAVKVTTSAGQAPKKVIEDAHFTITGTAIGGDARLPAFEDTAGLFRAGFTFLAPGKYEVTFQAKSDGVAIKTTRTVVTLESPAPAVSAPVLPPEPAPSEAPSAAPSASVKWM
jgi:hypothetical protein